MSDQPEIQISVIWPDVEGLPVYRANQFLGQLSTGPGGAPEEVVLTAGYIAPPVILGTPQEQQASLAALGAVSVKGLSRISMSRGRLQELIDLLGRMAAQYDNSKGDPT